jgi:hypothetical protein
MTGKRSGKSAGFLIYAARTFYCFCSFQKNQLTRKNLNLPNIPRIAVAVLMICWVFSPDMGLALDLTTIGVRGGISDGRNDEDFQQYEAFLNWTLPWERQIASDWRIGIFLEANAGALHGGSETAFVGSAGPGIHFSGFGGKIDIPLGVNPTVISNHTYGDVDFGGTFQFTSHVGLNVKFTQHFMMSYRLQHMSNAGIYKPNPGVNIHMLGIGYRF